MIAFEIGTQKWDKSGFMISQEGIVRCATKLEDRLVLWENLRLQLASYNRVIIGKKILNCQSDCQLYTTINLLWRN